jgi:SET domain-containing protein
MKQMGEFVIEYCGEVISSEEAKLRTQAYERAGNIDIFHQMPLNIN